MSDMGLNRPYPRARELELFIENDSIENVGDGLELTPDDFDWQDDGIVIDLTDSAMAAEREQQSVSVGAQTRHGAAAGVTNPFRAPLTNVEPPVVENTADEPEPSDDTHDYDIDSWLDDERDEQTGLISLDWEEPTEANEPETDTIEADETHTAFSGLRRLTRSAGQKVRDWFTGTHEKDPYDIQPKHRGKIAIGLGAIALTGIAIVSSVAVTRNLQSENIYAVAPTITSTSAVENPSTTNLPPAEIGTALSITREQYDIINTPAFNRMVQFFNEDPSRTLEDFVVAANYAWLLEQAQTQTVA